MKNYSPTNKFVNFAMGIIAALWCIYFLLLYNGAQIPLNYETQTFTSENNLKHIDPLVPGNIAYDSYQKLEQRYQKQRMLKNGEWAMHGGIRFWWFLGTVQAYFCDTCNASNNDDNYPAQLPEKNYTNQRYIFLPAWTINPQPAGHINLVPSEFYVEHRQSYIRKSVDIKVMKKSYGKHFTINQVDEPVKFRYDHRNNFVLIPVSAKTQSLWSMTIIGLSIIFTLYLFYLIAAFLKFVIDVSGGNIFTDPNVKRLGIIGFSLTAFPVFILALVFMARIIFSGYFSADLMLKTAIWTSLWPLLVAGIIFLLLFKAFKQGKKLKEDNDLTV